MNTVDVLLRRDDDPHRPSLENRVAYQWESTADLLGFRHSSRRDRIVLDWLADALQHGTGPRAALDVGCAFGNCMLMLNSRMGKNQDITYHGVELDGDKLQFARAFQQQVAGYANCHYHVADLEKGLPFPDRTFDAVNLADVLEHLENPRQALLELKRVMKPGATLVVSTPLKDSLFKAVAKTANTLTGGRLYRSYYAGKDTKLDEHGHPIMETSAGHDHISEMNHGELLKLAESVGMKVKEKQLMAIMSGSRFFDRHPVLLAFLFLLETLHDQLKIPYWAHSVCLRLEA